MNLRQPAANDPGFRDAPDRRIHRHSADPGATRIRHTKLTETDHHWPIMPGRHCTKNRTCSRRRDVAPTTSGSRLFEFFCGCSLVPDKWEKMGQKTFTQNWTIAPQPLTTAPLQDVSFSILLWNLEFPIRPSPLVSRCSTGERARGVLWQL